MTLNTIYIELVVTASQQSQQDIYMHGYIEIRVHAEKPYEENDIVDYNVLKDSLKQDGTYFIFTCSCGIPECGGRIKGIQVKSKNGIVEWVDLDFNKTWRFEKKHMLKQLETVKKEARDYKAFFKKKEIEYVGVEYSKHHN